MEELNRGRKKPAWFVFYFHSKIHLCIFGIIGIYIKHCIQRDWLMLLSEKPRRSFSFQKGNCRVFLFILFRIYGHQRLQDLDRYKRFHLTDDPNVQHRSEYPDVLHEGVLTLPEQR